MVKFGKLCHYFFKYFLGSALFLLTFWDSDDMTVIAFMLVPQVPETVFILFKFYFLSVVQIKSFLLFHFNVSLIFLLSLHFAVEIFISDVLFFGSNISV